MIGLILCERKFIMGRDGVHITGITVNRFFYEKSICFILCDQAQWEAYKINQKQNTNAIQEWKFWKENDMKVN